MFEELTKFLPDLESGSYGEFISNKRNDGTQQFPYVIYSDVVSNFMGAVYNFTVDHKELRLDDYVDILTKNGLEWDSKVLEGADVSRKNGRTVMAMIVGVIRAERLCDGALFDKLENGCVQKWLRRLKQIDEENAGKGN